MSEKIFAIRGVSIDYLSTNSSSGKAFRAIDNVTFDIVKGEVLGIAGESGCGKSTLAKALIRLIKPSEGEILFKGK